MIFWNIRDCWKKYALRSGIFWALSICIAVVYRLIGVERFQFLVRLLSERMPVTLSFVSWKDILLVEENFYSLFLVLYQIWFGYTLMKDTKKVWEEDRQTGRVYYFVNQLVTKSRYFAGKMLAVGINFFLMLSIYYIGLFMVWGISGCFFKGFALGGYLLRSFAVFGILVAIELLWCSFRNERREDYFEESMIGGTLFLGNVHRFLAFFLAIIRLMGRSGGILYKLRRIMIPLYWVSPISWLDPFHRFTPDDTGIMFVVSIFVTSICIVFAHFFYTRKEII